MQSTAPAALKEEETSNSCNVQLDAEDAEERYRRESVEFLTAEKIFDARWAMTILGEALKKLKHEYATTGKTSTFEALKVFLDPSNGVAPPSYDEVANRHPAQRRVEKPSPIC
jgi:hypothetical protein